MIFITGKYGSGKKKFVKDQFGVNDAFDGVFFATEFLESEFAYSKEGALKQTILDKITGGDYRIVISEERGCKVLPFFESHRRLIALNGEIACMIANIADEVYLVENGKKEKIK